MLTSDSWLLVFVGMVGMMMLFTAMQFYLLRTRIYGYYVLYMLCWLVYFIGRDLIDDTTPLYEFIRVAPAMLAYLMYYQFANLFIDMQQNSPLVYRMFILTSYILLCYVAFDFLLCFVLKAFWLHEVLHNAVRLYMIVVSVYGIFRIYNPKNILVLYFLIGSLCVVLGSTAAMVTSILWKDYVYNPDFISQPLFFMQVGILTELLCFSLGLAYKQQLIEKEKILIEQSLEQERKQYQIEKLQTIVETQQQERIRVAAELHDDIGSGLSGIRFLSEKILAKLPDLPDVKKISVKSKELVDNMKQIVWMMSDNETQLDDLMIYLRVYAAQYLEENNLLLTFEEPVQVPVIRLENEQRRHIFLAFKECLHNIVKHAQATRVVIAIETASSLKISVSDNGRGFQAGNGTGNGLKNMHKRMQAVKGRFELVSVTGTQVIFEVNI